MMRTSAEPTGGMRLREVGDGGEELDENDLWDTMDGPVADDVSTSDDDDEDDDDDDVAREDASSDARRRGRATRPVFGPRDVRVLPRVEELAPPTHHPRRRESLRAP